MTTASATPQQMRDRLLQAIDSQSNIRNMVAVLEVITYLEKYPITKEALEETRLGKLINDVRKKSRDEDLAKRAKKLLRSWQKLIEPGQAETPARGGGVSVPASANGGAHPCRTDAPAPQVSLAGKGVPEGRVRHDVHNTYSPKAEKSSSRKRRGEPRDNVPPAKLPKVAAYEHTHNCTSPPTNGIECSPEAPPEQDTVLAPDRPRTEPHLDNDKHSRIPVNAVKPHPSSPGMPRPPSTSSLLKTSVQQQQARLDEGGGGYQARSPRCLSSSPRGGRQETLSKRSATNAPRGTVPSPSPGSPLHSSQPSASPARDPCLDGAPLPPATPPTHKASMHWSSSSDLTPPPSHSTATLDPPSVSVSPPSLQTPEGCLLLRPSPPPSSGGPTPPLERKRRKNRSRDYSVNLGGQNSDDATKPVRLKERRITFDPVTGQIKPMVHKEPSPTEPSPSPPPPEPQQRTELPRPLPQPHTPVPAPNPSPFQQTNWKELSRNEIIQSYLNLQSSVLTSSGVQGPSAHSFMSDFLRREESSVREARKTHVLQTDSPVLGVAPGEGREVTGEDLSRLHTQHWPGVNGCYDTQGVWYDWTQGISLDPHGDDSRLNILPYICLD